MLIMFETILAIELNNLIFYSFFHDFTLVLLLGGPCSFKFLKLYNFLMFVRKSTTLAPSLRTNMLNAGECPYPTGQGEGVKETTHSGRKSLSNQRRISSTCWDHS